MRRSTVGAPPPPADPAKGEVDSGRLEQTFGLDMGPQRAGETSDAYRARISAGMHQIEFLITLGVGIALGPEAGAIVASFYAGVEGLIAAAGEVFGKAGEGLGRCGANPPEGPGDPNWVSWQPDGAGGYVFPATGVLTRAPRDPFVAWIQPLIRAAIEWNYNCQPVPDVLTLFPAWVALWNAHHASSPINTYDSIHASDPRWASGQWPTDDYFANILNDSQPSMGAFVPGPIHVNMGAELPPVDVPHSLASQLGTLPLPPAVSATARRIVMPTSTRLTGTSRPTDAPAKGTTAPAIVFIGLGAAALLFLKGKTR